MCMNIKIHDLDDNTYVSGWNSSFDCNADMWVDSAVFKIIIKINLIEDEPGTNP